MGRVLKLAKLPHHPIRAIPINKRLLQRFGKAGLTLLRCLTRHKPAFAGGALPLEGGLVLSP